MLVSNVNIFLSTYLSYTAINKKKIYIIIWPTKSSSKNLDTDNLFNQYRYKGNAIDMESTL